MNTVKYNNKHTHLATFAGRACLVLALSLASGVARAVPSTLNVPSLGLASSYTILSAAPGGLGAVTSTHSTVNGDVGSSGQTASIVQTGSIVTGSVIAPVSPSVMADFNRAYDGFVLLPADQVLSGTLAGMTLPPGVYRFDASAALTGALTLVGPANGIWVFRIGGSLTATSLSSVTLAGGARAGNVYWSVGQGVTLTDSNFAGTILAGTNTLGGASITITRGSFTGSAFAKAAITITDTTATKSTARVLPSNTTVPAAPGGSGAVAQTDRSVNQ